MENKLSKATMQALKEAKIIAIKAVSGASVTVETAALAPTLCQVHAMSGKTYDLTFDGDRFTLVERVK